MIGTLPRSLDVGGTSFAIRADYRNALTILSAFSDEGLKLAEKYEVMLRRLYLRRELISARSSADAISAAIGFLDGGIKTGASAPKKLYDWEQDEQLIFSAVNRAAGREVREDGFLHWWSFLGYFYEIGEGTFSTVVSIRDKRSKGKKLDEFEREFLRNNRELVELKSTYSAAEEAERERLREILGIDKK